jgi:hypothetical protein
MFRLSSKNLAGSKKSFRSSYRLSYLPQQTYNLFGCALLDLRRLLLLGGWSLSLRPGQTEPVAPINPKQSF